MKYLFNDFSSDDDDKSDHKYPFMRPENLEKLIQKDSIKTTSTKVSEKDGRNSDFKKWIEDEMQKKNLNPLEKSNI
jgi:hypothetical protein